MSKVSRAKALELWEVLCRAHGTMSAAIEKDMQPDAGMPLAWYEVLLHLTRAPQRLMRYQDLAKVAGISDSGASRRLEQMVNAGLIDRKTCPTDRRGVYAHITAAGEAGFAKAHAVFLRSLDRNLASHLEPDDADAMSAALSRLS
ncbi:MAG TPA: MarR family transcriptional regulator [Candidatus Acidoferrum sp.]|nr:MarR family transcriptional regulator [Candidatus Acidoferrum sp.]